jgi:ABC-type lipoprotein export system ATPase subunit
MSAIDSQPLIRAREVTKVYQVGASPVRALRGIDLDVHQGEFLAVVGVSGSGKSTLLHVLGGLDTPTSGQIAVSGSDLGRMSSMERSLYRREFVGFVFQSFYLVPSLSAEANVRVALTFQGTYGARRKALAEESLRRVGLGARAKHRPGQLSGGEQQRVSVARAIVHRPRLLLADEPTGNLDRQTATSLIQLIHRINRDSDMTVVLVTHDKQLVSQYCDRMVMMEDGRLAAERMGGSST